MKLNKSEKERNEAIEECKESNLALNELRDELLLLKKIHLDPLNYLSWTANDVIDYLCLLDNGKYKKYNKKLREIFIKESINGNTICYIDKSTLRDWGINNIVDRTKIFQHLQNILNQNQNKNQNVAVDDEGVPTAFI